MHRLGEVSLLSSALPPSDRLLAPGRRACVGCRWQMKAGLPSPGLPEVQYGAKLALSCRTPTILLEKGIPIIET